MKNNISIYGANTPNSILLYEIVVLYYCEIFDLKSAFKDIGKTNSAFLIRKDRLQHQN